jgi:DNA repair exonuclease SbcCD ATPase subunit
MLAGTPEIFQNCVIMTVNNTTPFMAKKKVEKRKFIEGIFNLQVFGSMLQGLRQDLNTEKQTYEVERTRFEEVEKSSATLLEQKKNSLAEKEKRENKLKKRRVDNGQEIANLQLEIKKTESIDENTAHEKINTCTDNMEKCDGKIAKINKKITEKETGIKYKRREQAKIGTDKDVCPTCLQNVTKESKKRIQKRSNTIDTQIETFARDLEDFNKDIDKFNDLRATLKTALAQYNIDLLSCKEVGNKKEKIDQLETWNTEIASDLANHVDEFTHINAAIEDVDKKIADTKKALSKLSDKIQILETVKFIVSEEGVKSFIVKKILNLFNSKLAYYLNKMDANCQCTFNEYFEEEIVNEKNNICSYFNFSGAERKNIDLACLFAFMDIRRMQGDVAYNVSVYDELLDSSLDEKGVELVLDILKERVEKYNECIMVISHRKESIKSATGDVIFLEKENGITRKVEYSEYGIN